MGLCWGCALRGRGLRQAPRAAEVLSKLWCQLEAGFSLASTGHWSQVVPESQFLREKRGLSLLTRLRLWQTVLGATSCTG